MRILFVTPQPPHPTQGGAAIRNWHLIRAAQSAGHETCWTTLNLTESVSLDQPGMSFSQAPKRGAFTRGWNLLRRQPDLALRLDSQQLRESISTVMNARKFSLIQVEGLEMWPSLPAVPLPPIVYDAHNAEAALQRGMAWQAWRDRDLPHALYSRVQTRKLARYEAAAMRQATITLAVSDADAAALRMLAPEADIAVVPIGVDTAFYAPDAPDSAAAEQYDVVFSGTMDYRANVDAALWLAAHIWPILRQRCPHATLAIVGKNPTARIRALDGHHGITVTGAVADDRPFMAGAGVYVLPMRVGAGVRVKLLNAMSMGCAVVATSGACAGVAMVDGEHAIVAEANPTAFATAVCDLLDDGGQRRHIGASARALMQARYDWAHIAPRLLAVYERLERNDD